MTPAEYLQSASSLPVVVSWHNNKRSYLSFRKEKKGIFIRLHRLFEAASPEVCCALAQYILERDKSAKPLLRKVVHSYFSSHRIPADRLTTEGQAYDLRPIYEAIKAEFFSPDYDAAIGWGRGGKRGKFRHMTFGTYDRHRHQILIHPLLDDQAVPEYFLSFIVYHEMLHAVCSPEIDARGYSRCHTREFRQKESLFPHYAAAKEWEKRSLLFFKKSRLAKFSGRRKSKTMSQVGKEKRCPGEAAGGRSRKSPTWLRRAILYAEEFLRARLEAEESLHGRS